MRADGRGGRDGARQVGCIIFLGSVVGKIALRWGVSMLFYPLLPDKAN